MSPDPHLLAADTPVEEAARLMIRYGYEGFPVVQDSKLVGLLTRRDVDRAISHKINKTASSLMKAGQYTVQPGDSVEHLQRLMTDTGWGQVPVVDPSTGNIIGIVTRTDLLKTLSPRPHLFKRQNLAEKLEKALPTERLDLLKAVAGIAFEQKVALYMVGGFVRDLILERPSLDFDLVVEGDAIALARALSRRYGGRVTSHTRFGTAKWFLWDAKLESRESRFENGRASRIMHHESRIPPLESLDLITARTEFYTHPTALPTVERSSVKLDLHRRDFTINTLALRLDGRHYGELYDYWGGLADLRQGLVRVLHSLSFIDDPTRMLRAVRFEQRFGFRIEQRTLELLHEAIPLLEKVSGDRIRHELDHILVEDRAQEMLVRLDELSLLKAIHAGLLLDDWFRERLETVREATLDQGWPGEIRIAGHTSEFLYILWLLRLPADMARGVVDRLKFSAALARTLVAARKLWVDAPSLVGARPSAVVDRLEEVPELAIYAVYIACEGAELRQLLIKYVAEWSKVSPATNGYDLRQRGLPPGPAYKQILKTLRDAWLDGEVSSKEQEDALLNRLMVAQDEND